MNFAVCVLPVAPIRKEPAHRSEMVSQLLFGEYVEILEDEKDFLLIRNRYDGYEGWCQRSQLMPSDNTLPEGTERFLVAQHTASILYKGYPMYLSAGTPLDFLQSVKQHDYSRLSVDGFDTHTSVYIEVNLREKALLFLNTPYLWGGRTVWGIDCSGFVQQVFRFFGKKLPRDAYQQAELGETVGFLQQAICGDLAFFDNAEGRIVHVGMMLGHDRIIHASGMVRIDPIDNMGIVHADTGERTHQLRIIKRIE